LGSTGLRHRSGYQYRSRGRRVCGLAAGFAGATRAQAGVPKGRRSAARYRSCGEDPAGIVSVRMQIDTGQPENGLVIAASRHSVDETVSRLLRMLEAKVL